MSEAAIVLWIMGFVVLTLNVGIICQTAEKIAQIKYGENDLKQKKWMNELEKNLQASKFGIIRND